MKDFLQFAISSLIVVIIVSLLIWGIIGFVKSTIKLLESIKEQEEAKEYCFEHGYLGVKWANGKYFCYNAEEVVPIE